MVSPQPAADVNEHPLLQEYVALTRKHFTDSSGALLIDDQVVSYLANSLTLLDLQRIDALTDFTSAAAPIVFSFRVTASLNDAEELLSELFADAARALESTLEACEAGPQTAETVELISALREVEDSSAQRRRWAEKQESRNLSQQIMNYRVQKAEQQLAQNFEKRLRKGKGTVLDKVDRVLSGGISVSSSGKERASSGPSGAGADDRTTHSPITLENVTLAFGSNVLLDNCDFRFHFRHRYAVVGRNGCGKSSLLRAIAHNEIPCFPDRGRCKLLYVSQEVAPSDERVLDMVLNADEDYVRLTTREKELLRLQDELCDKGVGDREQAALSAQYADELDRVYAEMDECGCFDAKARAASILAGLQFTPAMQGRMTKEFSGGWLMRISLARALFVDPDVLFLDEPDNHLDVNAMLWLENWLMHFNPDGLLVVVSHDANFLDQFATDVVLMCDKRLYLYSGNYTTFAKVRSDEVRNQKKAQEKIEQRKAKMMSFVDRFRYNAKRATLAQSRLKAIAKLEDVFVSEEGSAPAFNFPVAYEDPRDTQVEQELVEMHDVSFSYTQQKLGGFRLSHVDMKIMNTSRIALVGANGAGKSTILKLIPGVETPTEGSVSKTKRCTSAVFWQHHTDQFDLEKTPMQVIEDFCPGESDTEYRRQLGAFGIGGDMVFQPIRTLSGGQKSRLNFALITFRVHPTLLILDEPTNHLDIDTRVALVEALNEYDGAVVVVSHDSQLIEGVCDELWVVGDGTVKLFQGDFEGYKQMLRQKGI